MARRIVVLGGSGFVGRAFAGRAAARRGDLTLVVPTRSPARAAVLRMLPTVELVRADVHDARQLGAVLAGADAVVNLVAILQGDEAAFRRTHVDLVRTLVDAMRGAGVDRLVHVSALGIVDGQPGPSRYLRSKTEGEALVRASGLAWSVLRPSVIFGAEDRFLNLFEAMQALAPVVPLAGAQGQFQPVWVEDVAEALLRLLERDDTIGRVFEATGPQVHTLADLVRLAGARGGHARPVIALPDAVGRLQALAMEFLPGGVMSRDNLDSMRVPNVASGTLPALGDLGIAPASIASAALADGARARHDADLNAWRARAHGR
jgi:NADH dehydrogenase